MTKYIGVKMVDAKKMTLGEYNKFRGWGIPPDEDPEAEGMLVRYNDGYRSWCPKKQFEDQNFCITGKNNIITQDDVENMIETMHVETLTPPGTKSKTTFVQCILKNGFILTESSTCVDPANYEEKYGAEICMKKIEDKIWFLLGFLLRSAVYGFNKAVPAEGS
ncbi:MAG: hypothetical protein GY710_08600 [Desulfobacteraceae bacterium]|nr:hypothetical protein [Desulfobacteraceae bacterium]